jgi:hypothetical protein
VTNKSGASTTLAYTEMVGGIVTHTNTADATTTLPTGANMEAVASDVTGVGFEWSLLNRSTGSRALTLLPSTGHTIIGLAGMLGPTQGRFFTTRSSANTWVTYRIA